MGRKRKSSALDVYVGTSKVGSYARAANGSISFRYDPHWLDSPRPFPISLSMPLSDRIWSGTGTSSFFAGLLPDDRVVRERIAAREQAESAGTFDLLSAIGRDCVGALRFVPEGLDPGDPRTMERRPVGDGEIAGRLASLGTHPLGLQGKEDDLRISIAGVQEKTALLWMDGGWHLPLGPTPTSHIFKPPMRHGSHGVDFSDSPWNEWLCLKLCRALGLEAADAEVRFFDDQPILVVERFDRLWRDGILYRLPQEDVCQALGVPPMRKYQSDGGPGIVDVLGFLNGAVAPRKERLRFMKAQIVFWLLAAVDGHAKNFSIFLTPGGFRLTPLYDVISAAPYAALSPHKTKLAMAVGDSRHYRVKEIQPRHFHQTGQKAGLRKQDVDELFADLVGGMAAANYTVATLCAKAGAPASTYEPILSGARKRIGLLG